MIKSGIRLAAIAALAITLAGCAADNGQGTNTGTGVQQQGLNGNRVGVDNMDWDNQRNNNFRPMHNNTRMEISDQIADTLTDMDEVDSATVLLTDRNAYVAVVLDNGTGYGTTDTGRSVGKANTGQSTRMHQNSMGNNATQDRTGRRGPGNAQQGVTSDLESTITQRVRSVVPGVQNVYISANPDFVSRMRGYGERFQQGQPIRGLIIEFNTMVERIFPTTTNNNVNNQ
jgi:YhcN/YlaJ family sporulation lipoprotein